MDVEKIIQDLERRHPGEPEYIQAVKEAIDYSIAYGTLEEIEEIERQKDLHEKAKLIERLVEPERIITFRVPWTDDKG